MRHLKFIAIIIFLGTLGYAGTTLTLQDLPGDWAIMKKRTNAQLCAESCATIDCVRFSSSDKDLYTSTSAAPGGYISQRSQTGPCANL